MWGIIKIGYLILRTVALVDLALILGITKDISFYLEN